MKRGAHIIARMKSLKNLTTARGELLGTVEGTVTRLAPQAVTIEAAGALPGQIVSGRVKKRVKSRDNTWEIKLGEIIAPSLAEQAPVCAAAGVCGGCTMQTLDYGAQLALKEKYLKNLFKGYPYDTLWPSPESAGYRNKMEYSFGDTEKDGPLTLGMHARGNFYSVVNTDGCVLTDTGFDKIRAAVRAFFKDVSYYHKNTHKGFLRHLVVRRGKNGYLINIVTTSQALLKEHAFVSALTALDLPVAGVIHTVNDREADAVIPEIVKILYGTDTLEDEILGLKFEITPFSFFQVNTKGAEVLYSVVRDYAREALGGKTDAVIYDLYCGTGTISQVMAGQAEKVIGIELVEEAAAAARENAKKNGIDNCTFIAGDVLKEAAALEAGADLIILDPPRAGIHPKAIFKILDLAPPVFIYVSCGPESLKRDLPFFENAGYSVVKMCGVDMFPQTGHAETVALMTRKGESE